MYNEKFIQREIVNLQMRKGTDRMKSIKAAF